MRRNVLDHGYIELVDMMGDDHTPAMSARRAEEPRDWSLDGKLTKYMHEHDHSSPFEFVELTWRVKCPIFVARQWLRQRTANVNELSLRYEESDLQFYVPELWRKQSKSNRQGSGEAAANPWASRVYIDTLYSCVQTYEALIEEGVAREQARMILPVSVYTEFLWKNDLKNTLDFLRLRTDEHAQWEIRQYADAMVGILEERLPRLMEIVWRADER